MTKAHEKGCADCAHGWVEDPDEAGGAPIVRPCARCRAEDHARWLAAQPKPEQLDMRPVPDRPALPERRDLA